MNDNIIINTISKIHFIIISIFSFIFLTLFILFIMLQNGIYIDNISFPNIKAQQLYIKWNEKLNITVEKLELQDYTNQQNSKLHLQKTNKILKEIILFDTIFTKVLINKIKYNDIEGSFKYIDGGNGFLKLSSPVFDLNTSLSFESHMFNIDIDSFVDKDKDINIDGNIILNTYNSTELTASLNVNILNDIKLKVYSTTNLDKLKYKIESKNDIKSIKPIVDKYAYDWEAKWWVRDAIDMSSLTIKNISGYLEYNHIEEAYKSLHVEAIANDLKYTYNKKLDAIDTHHTELEFKGGELYIRPKNAYTYKTFLNKSWLKIDFTKDNTIINLHLLFKGMLNKDLLYLLSVYDIDLPLEQTKGELDTNLKIDIDLKTTDVEAHGTFNTKNAWINYLGLDLNVFDTNVILNNTNVNVKNMFVKYDDIASTHLDILFDAKKDIGKLDFRLDTTTFDDINVKLINAKKPLHVEYIINPKQDYINIDKSKWSVNDIEIDLDAMKLPFDINTKTAIVNKTYLKSKDNISASVSGKVLFAPLRAKLNLDITNFNQYNTTLEQDNLNLKLNYEKDINITSKESIRLKTSENIYILDNINMNIAKNNLYMKNINLSAENLFTSNMSLKYNLKNNKGLLDINNIDIQNKTFKEIFKIDKMTKLNIEHKNNDIMIKSNDYNIKYILNDYEWKIKVDSIKAISSKSKLLTKYFVDNGSFVLSKKYHQSYMNFLAKSQYKYKLLVLENKPVDKYTIRGKIYTKNNRIKINVNNVFDIDIKDNIQMKTKDIGLNIDDIFSLISDVNSTNASSKNMDVHFDSTNTYVYLSDKRYAISDNLSFDYKDKIMNATLKHNDGLATFEYDNELFALKGKNFNDKFMNKLFALSDMKGGSCGFSIGGSIKKYKGVIYVKDSTIIDYKLLNNVLAFINTVPNLLTFSLPGYSKNGLDFQRLYFDFQFENDIYNISNLYLDSKQIKIIGKGEASIKNNTIDMDINLKTDLGSSISKIPVVGYILLGEDSISTSLTLDGKLDDPKVNTQVSMDIVVAPWNILKRTLTYPMKLFQNNDEKKK